MGINNISRAEWDILYERFDLEGNSRVRKFSISFLLYFYLKIFVMSNSYFFLDSFTVHGFGARTISSGTYEYLLSLLERDIQKYFK